ncbi:hypothetical protein SAMN05421768_11029 [Chryseobacterium joostei]|uniref:Uncharacterized protein n=1 Tax=Chryseobacterium joostei TaxID=112234 RepID=A0A1N7K4M6_9FLAO|nr:hypothetical protein SAMN05421768_11029 [Chryseobacterium joostei]
MFNISSYNSRALRQFKSKINCIASRNIYNKISRNKYLKFARIAFRLYQEYLLILIKKTSI